ncbi:MAG: hypothetical protein WAU04_00680 [Candidatus Nitrotoga sp.]
MQPYQFLWSEGEGRWMGVEITEVVATGFRGSKVGIFQKIDYQCWRHSAALGRPPTGA